MNPSYHHFTVDVEEYFHPTAMASRYSPSCWDDLPRRAPGVVDRILGWLEKRDVRATFFVLGWLADREPEMVRSIHQAGHEVASHGWEHELVGRLGPDAFLESVTRSRQLLRELTGQEVAGYRAPSFSIVPGLEWAFDALLEAGYSYDASLFPISQHPQYGYPAAPLEPHWITRAGGRLLEFPTTTAQVGTYRLPAGGGAYFRLLPLALVRRGLGQAERSGHPGSFYIHPWELDDWAPALRLRPAWFRTFLGRRRCWKRLRTLFDEFEFGPMESTLHAMRPSNDL